MKINVLVFGLVGFVLLIGMVSCGALLSKPLSSAVDHQRSQLQSKTSVAATLDNNQVVVQSFDSIISSLTPQFSYQLIQYKVEGGGHAQGLFVYRSDQPLCGNCGGSK